MPIITKNLFFGEGISTYGEANPIKALEYHREEIRRKRLCDKFNSDIKLTLLEIIRSIETINNCIQAADNQVEIDNFEFITDHIN